MYISPYDGQVAGDESVVDHLLNHIQGQNVSRDVPLSRLLSILKVIYAATIVLKATCSLPFNPIDAESEETH